MLESSKNTFVRHASFARAESNDRDLAGDASIVPLQFSSLWRHKRAIALIVLASIALGVLITIIRPVTYTAVARLLIDNRQLQLSQKDVVFAQSAVDLPFVQNQLELLRSENVALRVIDDLRLSDDEEFGRTRRSLFGFGPSPAPKQNASSGAAPVPVEPDDVKRRLALQHLQKNVSIGRVGDSYTLEVRFTASTPRKAADIANGIVNSYMQDLIAANNEKAQSATAWLRDRLRELGPNARVITEAAPPVQPDGPGRLSILAASAILGTMMGAAWAFARDLLDRSIRTPDHAVALTDAECFGALPRTSRSGKRVPLTRGRQTANRPARSFRLSEHPLPIGVLQPLSVFSHTLRRLRTALTREHGGDVRAVGITSALPGEGKTTLAANLAVSLAQAGKRILLVDAVTYKPDLSRLLARDARAGLTDVLEGTIGMSEAIWHDLETSLHFLPAGKQQRVGREIWSEHFEPFLEKALSSYDFLVFDLPPLAPVADVRAAAHSLDALLLVIEWGKTPAPAIESCLAMSGPAKAKLLGSVLNKAKLRWPDRYGAAPGWLARRKRYSAYASVAARDRKGTGE